MSVQSKTCVAGMMLGVLVTVAHAQADASEPSTPGANAPAPRRSVFGVVRGGYDLGISKMPSSGEPVTGGEGMTIAAGLVVAPSESVVIEATLGYKYSTDSGGAWSVSRVPFDAIVSLTHDGHRFGIGGTVHFIPTVSCNDGRSCNGSLEGDTAFGLLLQWAYSYRHFDIGARATFISYSASDVTSETLGGNSLGIFVGARI